MTRTDRWTAAAVLALAALLRLPGLGVAPLDGGEAAHAWRALLLASAGDASVVGIESPLASAAQAAVFAFVGPGDARARVPAVCAGLALVLVPLLAWRALGRARVLACCAVLALDPWQVAASRRATGASAAVLAAALALAFVLRWAERARRDARTARREAAAAAAATGLLLTAGPAAWPLLPLVALVAWALRPWDAAAVAPGRLVAVAGATALACGSAGLLAVPWVSAISSSLTRVLTPGGAAQPLWLAGSIAAAGVASAAAGTLADTRGRGRARAAAAAVGVVAVLLLRPAVPVAADRGLRALAEDVRALSVERGFAADEMPLRLVGEPFDPEIAWALRGVRGLEWSPVRPAPVGAPPLLVSAAAASGTAEGYAPRGYGTVTLWVPRAP